MKKINSIKLQLSKEEKAKLRSHKFKIADVLDLAVDELPNMKFVCICPTS